MPTDAYELYKLAQESIIDDDGTKYAMPYLSAICPPFCPHQQQSFKLWSYEWALACSMMFVCVGGGLLTQ